MLAEWGPPVDAEGLQRNNACAPSMNSVAVILALITFTMALAK